MNINDIAKAFLNIESMSNKKLQKLCYYFYSWDIALNGIQNKKLDVRFEAWVHGPVSPILYTKYKMHGYKNIPKESEMPTSIREDEYAHDLVNQVFRIYGKLTGDELEIMTHEEEPWKDVRVDLKPYTPSTKKLSDDTIYTYYRTELDNLK